MFGVLTDNAFNHVIEQLRVVQDVFVNQVRATVLNADIDRGKVVQETLDVRREFVEPNRINGGDTDRAADDLLHLLQLAQELFVLVQHLLRGLVHTLTLSRQLKLFLAAIDQQRFEMPLHRTCLLAHGGLRDSVYLGGFGEALRLDQIGEYLKVFDLHGSLRMPQHYKDYLSAGNLLNRVFIHGPIRGI